MCINHEPTKNIISYLLSYSYDDMVRRNLSPNQDYKSPKTQTEQPNKICYLDFAVQNPNPFPSKPLSRSLSLSKAKMALLQIHTPPHNITTLSPILSFHSSPPPHNFSLPHSLKSHHQNSLFSTTPTTKNTPFSLSTLPRKLLCQPPNGKYVREDYLVVCVPLNSH